MYIQIIIDLVPQLWDGIWEVRKSLIPSSHSLLGVSCAIHKNSIIPATGDTWEFRPAHVGLMFKQDKLKLNYSPMRLFLTLNLVLNSELLTSTSVGIRKQTKSEAIHLLLEYTILLWYLPFTVIYRTYTIETFLSRQSFFLQTLSLHVCSLWVSFNKLKTSYHLSILTCSSNLRNGPIVRAGWENKTSCYYLKHLEESRSRNLYSLSSSLAGNTSTGFLSKLSIIHDIPRSSASYHQFNATVTPDCLT